MIRALAALLLLLLASAHPAAAQARVFVGARNLGMGGTGVGGSTDALAVEFNPAGMAFAPSWEVELPLITADAEIDGDLFREIDEIQDLFDLKSLDAIQADLDGGTATDEDLQTVLRAFLYEVPDLAGTADGATLRAIAGPAFRWKNWGVSLIFVGDGGASATVDLEHALSLGSGGFDNAIPDPTPGACGGDPFCLGFAGELIAASGGTLDQDRAEVLVSAAGTDLASDAQAQALLVDIVEATAQGDDTLADNQSSALTVGIVVSQVAFTYSHQLLGEKLALGANAKWMRGETYARLIPISELQDGEDTFRDIFDGDSTASDTQLGLDLGVMYRPGPAWSLGLVANNVNRPAFELSQDLGEIEIDPLFRVGAAYRPCSWFGVAADLDLNEVDSGVVPTISYRYANLGFEFLAGRWFQGWLGAYSNLARSGAGPSVTAGFGIGLGRFTIALAGAVALEDAQLATGEDPASFPTAAAASLQLGWRPHKQG